MDFQKHSDNIIDKTLLPFISRKITPNQVSWLRIISIPFIYYLLIQENYLSGFIVFSLSALTDAIDGAMARKRNQITNFGKILDPIADKSLIALVALIFIPKYFGWELLIGIATVEIINALLAYFSKRQIGGKNPGANWAGKIKMILQSIAFILIFIGILSHYSPVFYTAKILLYLSVLFTLSQIFFYPYKKLSF